MLFCNPVSAVKLPSLIPLDLSGVDLSGEINFALLETSYY